MQAINAGRQPFRLKNGLRLAADRLSKAVRAKRAVETERATVELAQWVIDLEARYLPNEVIEAARFHLHSQKLRVDAADRKAAGVIGEVAVLEWIAERLSGSIDADAAAELRQDLLVLRTTASAGNLASAADVATRLAAKVQGWVEQTK